MARFIRRGVSQFLFDATAPVDYASPLRAELTAADDITDSIAAVSGFMLENQPAATPDMGSKFETNVPGVDSAGDSTLTLYEDEVTDTLEAQFPKDQEGVLYILRKGDIPASTSMDVFHVKVASKGPEYSTGNEPARFVVKFTIIEEPSLDVAIPA